MKEPLRNWLSQQITRYQWLWQHSLQRRIILSYGLLFLLVLALLMLQLGLRVYRAQISQAEHELELKAFLAANAFEDPLNHYARDFAIAEQLHEQKNGEAETESVHENDDRDGDDTLIPRTVSTEVIDTIESRLQQSAVQMATRARARVAILSAHGDVIADSDLTRGIVPNQRHQPEVKAALNSSEQHDVRLDYNGTETLFTAAPIHQDGEILGVIQLSQPMYEVLATNRELERELIVTAVLAMVLVSGVGIWNGRRMLQPVEELTEAAMAIAQGDLQRQAPVSGNDEITALAKAFNSMVSNLRSMIEQQRLFVANASHELRTPLFNIKLRSEALLNMEAEEQGRARRFLTEIDSEVDRLGRMANSLLDLSRLESAQNLPLNVTPTNIAPILLEAAQSMRMRIRQAGLTFLARIPEETDLIAVDEADIETLILNLLDNAIKYTPAPGTISLTLENREHICQITIQDSGVGIPAEDLPHIYDGFYRTDKARSRTRGQKGIGSGAGLGLSIVKALVERNQGEIQVTSQEGVGTTFTVSFPKM